MQIPNSNRERALLVVDVQPKFLNDRIRYMVNNICSLVERVPYSFYVQGLLHAEEDSLWYKQHNWLAPTDGNMLVDSPLGDLLAARNPMTIVKTTRSIFKGDPPLLEELRRRRIREVHVVGLDTYDCITASAHEAFDLGFFTYIIEECCQATSGNELHDRAIENLRYVNLTNNSCCEKVDFIEVVEAR